MTKWETGETIPYILICDALARFYDVELEDLIHHDPDETNVGIAPKGKHIFGTARVGERGLIVLPKQARDIFKIRSGDILVVLGDESVEYPGLALMKEEFFLEIAQMFKTVLKKLTCKEEIHLGDSRWISLVNHISSSK